MIFPQLFHKKKIKKWNAIKIARKLKRFHPERENIHFTSRIGMKWTHKDYIPNSLKSSMQINLIFSFDK